MMWMIMDAVGAAAIGMPAVSLPASPMLSTRRVPVTTMSTGRLW